MGTQPPSVNTQYTPTSLKNIQIQIMMASSDEGGNTFFGRPNNKSASAHEHQRDPN